MPKLSLPHVITERENGFAPNFSLSFNYLFLIEELERPRLPSFTLLFPGQQQPHSETDMKNKAQHCHADGARHCCPPLPKPPSAGARSHSLVDVLDEPAHLALPLLRGQPRVHRQVLHHVEVVPHFVSEPLKGTICEVGAGDGGKGCSSVGFGGTDAPSARWDRAVGGPQLWRLEPRVPTCEVAELRDEHGRAGQAASGTPPPLGLAHQHRLFQVGDFLVILLFERRKVSLLTVDAFSDTSMS